MDRGNRKFRFVRVWLLTTVAMLTLQSFSWVVIGSFDPFGVWDRMLNSALFHGEPIETVIRFRQFILGPFGASVAAYWIVIFFVVWFVFPKREAWGWWAVGVSLMTWFVTDSVASLAHGAMFNVLLVNVPCLLLVGIPLALLYPHVCKPRGNMVVDRSVMIAERPTTIKRHTT